MVQALVPVCCLGTVKLSSLRVLSKQEFRSESLVALQEAMAAAQKAGAKGMEEPIMPPIMEPSAADPGVKKSKKRKVAEAQAVEAQAAEADAEPEAAPSTPPGMLPLS